MKSCNEFLRTNKYDGYCSNVAVVCIVLGLSFSLLAFFYPVSLDFTMDPSESAEENEDRRSQQTRTQTNLYNLSLTGVVLVTIGGLLSAFLLSKFILVEECFETEEEYSNAATGLPFTSNLQRDNKTSEKICNTEGLCEGQNHKLVDSDYLYLNGASANQQQYGSTT